MKSLRLAIATLLVSLPFSLQLTPNFLGKEVLAQTPVNQNCKKTWADRLYQQGVNQLNRRQSQAALRTFQQVLAVRKQLGDRRGEAAALFQIGKVYEQQGQKQLAQQYYRQARERLVL